MQASFNINCRNKMGNVLIFPQMPTRHLFSQEVEAFFFLKRCNTSFMLSCDVEEINAYCTLSPKLAKSKCVNMHFFQALQKGWGAPALQHTDHVILNVHGSAGFCLLCFLV